MDPISRLSSLFERFPGIGPRQAGRFVQYLLRTSPAIRRELASSLKELGEAVHRCPECGRFHSGENKICDVCGNPARDTHTLVVVATDTDMLAMEKSGAYRGRYFILGGTMSLASEKANGLRTPELLSHIQKQSKKTLEEVIFAFPANPEGDATASRLRAEIADLKLPTLRISSLGRGLSTGSELEYADPETIKSALEGRK